MKKLYILFFACLSLGINFAQASDTQTKGIVVARYNDDGPYGYPLVEIIQDQSHEDVDIEAAEHLLQRLYKIKRDSHEGPFDPILDNPHLYDKCEITGEAKTFQRPLPGQLHFTINFENPVETAHAELHELLQATHANLQKKYYLHTTLESNLLKK